MAKELCELYYGKEYSGCLSVCENGEFRYIAKVITYKDAMKIASELTQKHDEVRLFDDECEGYISHKPYHEPTVNTCYEDDHEFMAKKYGLYKEVSNCGGTDLDKEKWDNYWSDFNQCGVRIYD